MWKNRIVPTLLALCMVMALLPASVFAAAGDGTCKCTATHSGGSDHSSGCSTTTSYTKYCSDCAGKDGNTQMYACSCTGDCVENFEGTHATGCSGAEYSLTEAGACAKCKEAKEALGGDDDNEGDTPAIVCGTCGCEVTANSDCKVEDQFGATATSCAHDEEGETGGNRGADCKYTVCKVANCVGYGKNLLTSSHTHNDVTAGDCESGQTATNSKKVNCQGETHYDGCPKKCEVDGCNKEKNHTTTHAAEAGCTNDKLCGVTADVANIASHKSTCPQIANLEAEAGKVLYTYTNTYDVTGLNCGCDAYKHTGEDKVHDGTDGAAACGKALTGTYSISVTVQVADTNTTDAEKKAAAETDAGSNGINTAKDAALEEWKAAHTVNSQLMCDYCLKAAKDQAAADKNAALAACTMAFDCPSTEHRKNCLSQCTHNGQCTNDIGNASAHTVWYQIQQTNADGATTNVANALYKTYEAAIAERNNLKAANDALVAGKGTQAEKDAAKITYSIATNHCPKAGVADSTVLGGDDTATDPTEPTTPEVKPPEKAEEFADLDGTEWYAEELTALVEKGIFTGSLDDGKYSFNATGNVTGAELVVLLSRVAGEDLVTTGAEWNKAATAWASEAGYTEGVDITTTGALTRQDVILVLWRAAGSPDSQQSLEDFPDAEGLEGEYLTAMKWAVEKSIIKGDGDTGEIKADASITRAEIVAVLSRYSEVK